MGHTERYIENCGLKSFIALDIYSVSAFCLYFNSILYNMALQGSLSQH